MEPALDYGFTKVTLEEVLAILSMPGNEGQDIASQSRFNGSSTHGKSTLSDVIIVLVLCFGWNGRFCFQVLNA
jgi:hypothetical protein